MCGTQCASILLCVSLRCNNFRFHPAATSALQPIPRELIRVAMSEAGGARRSMKKYGRSYTRSSSMLERVQELELDLEPTASPSAGRRSSMLERVRRSSSSSPTSGLTAVVRRQSSLSSLVKSVDDHPLIDSSVVTTRSPLGTSIECWATPADVVYKRPRALPELLPRETSAVAGRWTGYVLAGYPPVISGAGGEVRASIPSMTPMKMKMTVHVNLLPPSHVPPPSASNPAS